MDEVPAIGDANSIQWALGKQIGDTIDYTDEQGRTFKAAPGRRGGELDPAREPAH